MKNQTPGVVIVGVSLVMVLFGPEINGTRRWFGVAGIGVQPSELAKIAAIFFTAALLERRLERINDVSGISTTADQLAAAVDAPISKATFLLAERFGWTPQEVGELTLGQVLLHLRLIRDAAPATR